MMAEVVVAADCAADVLAFCCVSDDAVPLRLQAAQSTSSRQPIARPATNRLTWLFRRSGFIWTPPIRVQDCLPAAERHLPVWIIAQGGQSLHR